MRLYVSAATAAARATRFLPVPELQDVSFVVPLPSVPRGRGGVHPVEDDPLHRRLADEDDRVTKRGLKRLSSASASRARKTTKEKAL